MVTIIAIGATLLAAATLTTTFIYKGMHDSAKEKMNEYSNALEDQTMINAALQVHADEMDEKYNSLLLEMNRRNEQRKADKKKAAKMKSTKVEAVIAEPTTTSKRKYTKKSN